MPTFHDPLADAAEASEALRGLAHASRVFDNPADTYTVFGDLVAGVRSLRQVLDQLAAAHLAHRDRAHHDDGDHLAGAQSALAAADNLHQACTLLDQVHDRLSAAFSHSGRIAWHPEPASDRVAAREQTASRLDGLPVTTTQAGRLTLTVWPDTPLGEHQRYAYRITDVATRQELEGRDLFTGAGAPVDPDRALSELAGFLTAAGDARQYALDHPGNTPENEGLFPAWVADAARENADPLTVLSELAEHDPPEPEPEPVEWRWISVVFLQGSEADEVLDLIDAEGVDAAIEHLKGFDYGDETTQAALENGYVYDEPPTGARDQVVNDGGYALTYNPFAGDVGLLREHSTPPQDALDESGVVSAREATAGIGALEHTSAPAPRAEKAEAPRTGPPRAGARRAPDASWFTHPDIAAAKQARGLSR